MCSSHSSQNTAQPKVRVWRCGGWQIDRVDGAPRSEQPRSSPRGSARCRDRRSRSSPNEMTLATATGSAPRPRTIARPPPARRRPTRRARRERPVRGSARVSGRLSSRCRTAGPAPLRVRDSPPSSPRRPGPHPTTRGARVQGELSVFICVRFGRPVRGDSLEFGTEPSSPPPSNCQLYFRRSVEPRRSRRPLLQAVPRREPVTGLPSRWQVLR